MTNPGVAWQLLGVSLAIYLAGVAFYFGMALGPDAPAFGKFIGLLWAWGGSLLMAMSAALVYPAVRAGVGKPFRWQSPFDTLRLYSFGVAAGLICGSAVFLGFQDVGQAAGVAVAGLALAVLTLLR